MVKSADNPWQYMREGTARRVDISTLYDFFWICDDEGRSGLMIHFVMHINNEAFVGQMRGISIATNQESGTKFYLILQETKDWELFLAVCNDIVNRASASKDEHDMVRCINQRIRRWQRFLSEDNVLRMTERVQMGLFAELCCIRDILIPALGYRNAIIGWVGPDADQKDFSIEGCFIEVKSYISSKGQRVKISSLGQLNDDVKSVFLLCYGLTISGTGISIPNVVDDIYRLIPIGDVQSLGIFEDRLASYGYLPDITQPPFSNYLIDMKRSYRVERDFPRISIAMLNEGIANVNYTIDLSKCANYESLLPF